MENRSPKAKRSPRRAQAWRVLALCAAALLLTAAAVVALHSGPRPGGADQAPYPQPSDTVPAVRSDGSSPGIPVTYCLPEQPKGAPLAVLCHGFKGNREADGHFAPLAQELAARGIASVRPDFPGCGESSEGFACYTLENMMADITAVIDWMAAQHGVDSSSIALVGHSMGGRLASLYAAQGANADAVRGVALWSPANGDGLQGLEFLDIDDFSAVEALRGQAAAAGTADCPAWDATMSSAFFEQMAESHPNQALAGYGGRILLCYTPNEGILSEQTVAETTAAVETAGGLVIPREAFPLAGHNYTAADYELRPLLDTALDEQLRCYTVDFLLLPALTGAAVPEATPPPVTMPAAEDELPPAA